MDDVHQARITFGIGGWKMTCGEDKKEGSDDADGIRRGQKEGSMRYTKVGMWMSSVLSLNLSVMKLSVYSNKT